MRSSRHVGTRVALVSIAVALLCLALLSLPWFRSSGTGFFRAAGDNTFYEIHLALNRLRVGVDNLHIDHSVHIDALSVAYFGWLGWTSAGVALLTATAATSLHGRIGTVLRVLAVLVSATAIGLSIAALDLVRYSGPITRRMPAHAPQLSDYLAHSWFGAWCAILAFVVLGVAGALGAPAVAASTPDD